jgi:ribosome maturation factor RimP
LLANEVIERVWRELEPEVNAQGYDLVEVEFGHEAAGRVLRLYIDKPGGGITLDDCQTVSHVVGATLDRLDFLQDRYVLEVSSPGIDRPIRKGSDFERFEGEKVKLVAQTPVSGRKRFHGILKGFEDGLIKLDCDGALYEVHIENVKKANLDR